VSPASNAIAKALGLPITAARAKNTSTWNELSRYLIDYYEQGMIFRGQAMSSWPIETRLARGFASNEIMANERRMLQIFRSEAADHLRLEAYMPGNNFEWSCYMQHFGAATRLLDWSKSPFIALYFAAESHDSEDAAVWALNYDWFAKMSRRSIARRHASMQGYRGDPGDLYDSMVKNSAPSILHASPAMRFRRMVSQAAVFTIVGDQTASFSVNVTRLASDHRQEIPKARPLIIKIEIPASEKPQILYKLESMNITKALIYPGLDGLAGSLSNREYVDPYHA
jgi:hypothetical protein